MSGRDGRGEDRLAKAIRAANDTLAKIELQEKNFYKTYGKHEDDFLNSFISVRQREENVSKQFMKRFDQLINDVNMHLKILEARTSVVPENKSSPSGAVGGTPDKKTDPKKEKEEDILSSDASSSATDLSTQDYTSRLVEIEDDLKQLEKRIINIDMRIREDAEAEEIGIAFPIADIIDYMTAIKVAMYKRHLLTQQLYCIVLSDEKYAEEAKMMKRDYAIWTKEEREDLLTKMTLLEDSLIRLEQLPLVQDDEFNKYYPLTNDLRLLKRLVARFLDKFEMNSTVPTARLATSFTMSRVGKKQLIASQKEMKMAELSANSLPGSLQKGESKNDEAKGKNATDSNNASDDDLQPIRICESETDIRTAVEKSSEKIIPP